MNKLVGNKDKRIALLLAMAFAWLFISSLIFFHEEHVLGKHFRMNTHLFINPSPKEKKETGAKLFKLPQKLADNGTHAGITGEENYSFALQNSVRITYTEYSSEFPDEFLKIKPFLRAPPVI
jgi:hypothetical protein